MSSSAKVLAKAKDLVSSNPVFVFSKTYCGYCARVKQLFTQLGAPYKAMELDRESENHSFEEIDVVCHEIDVVCCSCEGDGGDVQAALAGWTGQTSVPNVFIGGKHIGGCDSVMGKHKEGKLVPLLTAAGALAKKSAKI